MKFASGAVTRHKTHTSAERRLRLARETGSLGDQMKIAALTFQGDGNANAISTSRRQRSCYTTPTDLINSDPLFQFKPVNASQCGCSVDEDIIIPALHAASLIFIGFG